MPRETLQLLTVNPHVMDSSSRVPKKPRLGCCGQHEAEPLGGDTWAGPRECAWGRGAGKVALAGIPWALWWQIEPYPEPASLFPSPGSHAGPRFGSGSNPAVPPWGDTFSPVSGCPQQPPLLPGALQAHEAIRPRIPSQNTPEAGNFACGQRGCAVPGWYPADPGQGRDAPAAHPHPKHLPGPERGGGG